MNQPAKNVAKKRRQIGKYRLIASLGQGGMAKVYLALMAGPAGFNKLLVIKALREDMAHAEGDFVGMFLEEARLAAQLNHPNVVQTYEVGEADGRYFIAMEYLEGQSLRTVQRRLGHAGMPLADELRVLSETARGLHYAHELRGFDGTPLHCVHRDVSPQNVFLTYDGQVKLLDFGIAKTGTSERDTQVGVIKGKADYIAPEQVRGESIDRRADVFSLGAMMWEALAGQRFAGGPNVADVTKIHNRVTGAETPLSEAAPDAPEALRAICERAIAIDPNERFASAEEFAIAIDGYLAESPESASRTTLGALLCPSFEVEREKLRELIDAQVQAVQAEPTMNFPGSTGTLPSLSPQSMPHSESRIQVTDSGPVDAADVESAREATATPTGSESGRRPERSTLLDLTTYAPVEEQDSDIPSGPGRTVTTRPAAATPSEPSVAAAAPQPPQKRVSLLVASLISVGAIVVAAYLAVATPADEAPAVPAAPVAVTPAEVESESAPVIETVSLKIRAKTRGVAVTLDDAEIPKLPFDAVVENDGKLHRLVARAHGYRTLRQVLIFDQDHDLLLELSPRRSSDPPEEDETGSDPRATAAGATGPSAAGKRTEATSAKPTKPQPKRTSRRRQVVAPGENLIGSTTTRTPSAPRIDVEDPYQ